MTGRCHPERAECTQRCHPERAKRVEGSSIQKHHHPPRSSQIRCEGKAVLSVPPAKDGLGESEKRSSKQHQERRKQPQMQPQRRCETDIPAAERFPAEKPVGKACDPEEQEQRSCSAREHVKKDGRDSRAASAGIRQQRNEPQQRRCSKQADLPSREPPRTDVPNTDDREQHRCRADPQGGKEIKKRHAFIIRGRSILRTVFLRDRGNSLLQGQRIRILPGGRESFSSFPSKNRLTSSLPHANMFRVNRFTKQSIHSHLYTNGAAGHSKG